jgi:2-amino-4-hydroxy-6-hydroxymethyldihydropteridine diphosphokinase
MPTAYLAIGSNLGDRQDNIRNAIDLLKDNGIVILKQSSLIETEPVNGPPQGLYLNGALAIQTELSAPQLLDLLHSIENSLGRVRSVVNGARTIDLDILLFDDMIIQTKNLIIPHPRMKERDFVMKPLREIAPHLDYANL